ncbi:hypothetical protein LCGC14_2074610 [marine sediment metagenome]|uniref:Uncharacterized protein n=1 Tax=marine sediment metagenome TaxID=412755 RepID=A0A0F9F4Q7_9ZZZZ
MPRVGMACPHCTDGQLLPDNQDSDAISCLQCGYVYYSESPAEYEPDRRSRTDNRQNPVKFADEYRKGMSEDEFNEAFSDLQDIMEEGS